jgi:hypothetical protein
MLVVGQRGSEGSSLRESHISCSNLIILQPLIRLDSLSNLLYHVLVSVRSSRSGRTTSCDRYCCQTWWRRSEASRAYSTVSSMRCLPTGSFFSVVLRTTLAYLEIFGMRGGLSCERICRNSGRNHGHPTMTWSTQLRPSWSAMLLRGLPSVCGTPCRVRSPKRADMWRGPSGRLRRLHRIVRLARRLSS